jgi:molybdopterin-binding protein
VGVVAELRTGRVAELLGVSVDTVRRMADRGELPTRRSPSGERFFDGEELARHLDAEASSELPAVVATSARNRFPGIVTRVVSDTAVATVELRCGPHRLVSIMTAEAVEDLGLHPGVLAVATVKSTNVVVEVPTP